MKKLLLTILIGAALYANDTNLIQIQTIPKQNLMEVISVVDGALYNDFTKKWEINYLDEGGECMVNESNVRVEDGTWFVLTIDTKGTNDLMDDETIEINDFDGYAFEY